LITAYIEGPLAKRGWRIRNAPASGPAGEGGGVIAKDLAKSTPPGLGYPARSRSSQATVFNTKDTKIAKRSSYRTYRRRPCLKSGVLKFIRNASRIGASRSKGLLEAPPPIP
jgi:hypothetical protein